MLTLLIQAVLTSGLLLLICNWHAVYEEDLMAKAAEITYLKDQSHWRHYASSVDYYSRDLFSSYYLAATAFYAVTGLPALESLNLFSVLCGVFTFSLIPFLLRKVYSLPQWLSWLVLVHCPILVITFTYGNEAAFGLAMTSFSVFALTFRFKGAVIVAAFFYVLSAYARPDFLFLWPALSLLLMTRNEQGRLDLRGSIHRILPFAAASAVFGITYLLVFIRKWPTPDYMVTQTTLKVAAAFVVYSLNPFNFLLFAAGLATCLWRRRYNYLCLLLVFVQFVPYLRRFNSPKYILASVVVMAVFAMAALLPFWKSPRFRVFVPLVLILPWFISISPFGIFGPSRAPYWYVPTDDGPLPTGGLQGFYSKVKSGFYQDRYVEEMLQFDKAFQLVEKNPGAKIFGYFNQQTIRLWSARRLRWDIPPQSFPFWAADDEHPEDIHPRYSLRVSYLYPVKFPSQFNARLEIYCREGRVRNVDSKNNEPLPQVIEFGSSVPMGNDPSLGARILFFNEYYQGNQVLGRDSLLKDFSGLAWIPRSGTTASKPLYQDESWTCLDQEQPSALYYSARFPIAYSKYRTAAH